MRSICVGENGGAPSIYKDKQSADDENGLPVYYKTESRYGKKNAGLQEKAQARMERKKGWMKLM